MKKKIFIVFVLFIIAFIIVNLLYDFFMADGVKSIREKIAYRKFYNEREILENVNNENALTHGDIIVELKEKSYDKETGKVRLFFVFNNIKDINDEYKSQFQSKFSSSNPVDIAMMEKYIENAYDSIREKANGIQVILNTVKNSFNPNAKENIRSISVNAMISKERADSSFGNLNVDTDVVLSPENTHIKISDYEYNTENHKFEVEFNDNSGDYTITSICNKWIIVLPSYVDNIFEIIHEHVSYLSTLMSSYNMLSFEDVPSFNYEIAFSRLYLNNIDDFRSFYHFIINMKKNFEIFDKALNEYINPENHKYLF